MPSNNDNSSRNERRRHTRHPISKPVRTRAKTREHRGKTKNISGSGVAIEPNSDMDHDGLVEVEIEDVGTFSGRVSRSSEEDDLYAVSFDFDKYEQEQLIADLTEMHDDIVREEN
ncbi:MAG: PilZ domain-containing protein [Rhodospirillales bacterium]